MTPKSPAPPLAPEVVIALARLAGYPPPDADTAARIAIGAGNAVRAVAASATGSLFETEPAAFLEELERLAEPG
jgi:hypothetical protein